MGDMKINTSNTSTPTDMARISNVFRTGENERLDGVLAGTKSEAGTQQISDFEVAGIYILSSDCYGILRFISAKFQVQSSKRFHEAVGPFSVKRGACNLIWRILHHVPPVSSFLFTSY